MKKTTMKKTYIVHSIVGKRFDGTNYSSCFVESIDEDMGPIPEKHYENEHYTEKHSCIFRGSRGTCKKIADANNDAAREKGIYGKADCCIVLIDGEEHRVEYDYHNGIKTVRIGDWWEFCSVSFDLKTGEIIDGPNDPNKINGYKDTCKYVEEHENAFKNGELFDDEVRAYEKCCKMIKEHDSIVAAMTTKNNKEAA